MPDDKQTSHEVIREIELADKFERYLDEQELRQKQVEEFLRRCREQGIDVDVTAGR